MFEKLFITNQPITLSYIFCGSMYQSCIIFKNLGFNGTFQRKLMTRIGRRDNLLIVFMQKINNISSFKWTYLNLCILEKEDFLKMKMLLLCCISLLFFGPGILLWVVNVLYKFAQYCMVNFLPGLKYIGLSLESDLFQSDNQKKICNSVWRLDQIG